MIRSFAYFSGMVSKSSSQVEKAKEDDQRFPFSRSPHSIDVFVSLRRNERSLLQLPAFGSPLAAGRRHDRNGPDGAADASRGRWCQSLLRTAPFAGPAGGAWTVFRRRRGRVLRPTAYAVRPRQSTPPAPGSAEPQWRPQPRSLHGFDVPVPGIRWAVL